MRTLMALVAPVTVSMALVAAVMVSTAAADYEPCGGKYGSYPGWAQEAFCQPQPGGD